MSRRSIQRGLSLALAVFCLGAQQAQADVQLGATRVIYRQGQREVGLRVHERSTAAPASLIQSWIDAADGSPTAKMIVVPPLFRLEPGASRNLRIVQVGDGLPGDRESLFWLNVKVVPPSDRAADNVLKAAVVFQLKLLYRPRDLSGDANGAYRRLRFARGADGRLQVSNPTPFHVCLDYLRVDGLEIPQNAPLAPYATASFPLAGGQPRQVVWAAIDDYGAKAPQARFDF